MKFQVSSRLAYTIAFPSTLILSLHAQSNDSQLIETEQFGVEPRVPVEHFTVPGSENRFVRLSTGDLKTLTITYSATVDCHHEVLAPRSLGQLELDELPPEVIPYLFPSRYCQSDRLSRLAWDLFGKLLSPHHRVVAIVNWIHNNVDTSPAPPTPAHQPSIPSPSATGVCRDFAHLGIALCAPSISPPATSPAMPTSSIPPTSMPASKPGWVARGSSSMPPPRAAEWTGPPSERAVTPADAAVATIFGSAKSARPP